MDRKVFEEIVTKKFFKFDENYKATDPRRSTNPKKDKHKEKTTIKSQETNVRENLKGIQ